MFLRHGDYDEVEAWLRSIKGIGEWSAQFVMVRGLGRIDRLPIEQRLLMAASERYQQTMTPDSLRKLAVRYGPWQGYWAHYLRAAS
jgi:DNA-3-methyladenine glycosylase II